jgi:hypothetical protein
MANYRSPSQILPIAAHWEMLDIVLQRTLAEVMEHDHTRVALLTENIPFRIEERTPDGLHSPLKEEEPTLWDEFTRFHADLQAAYGKRNRYVHARWKEGHHPGLPIRVVARSAGGRFIIADEETCICEMEDAAQFIHATGNRLVAFFQKFDLLK